MTARTSNRRFAARPDDPDAWVRAPEPSVAAPGGGRSLHRPAHHRCDARVGARIKITAFQRGQTVADMLRDLLAREFPATDGGQT
jgi:hypothetical protein